MLNFLMDSVLISSTKCLVLRTNHFVENLSFCGAHGWNPSGDWVILFFSGQKLVPEYFKPYHIFLHFSRAIKCSKLYEITSKKRFIWEPEKINFKFHRNWENTGKIVMNNISFWEIWSLWSLFSWVLMRAFSLELFHITYYIYFIAL